MDPENISKSDSTTRRTFLGGLAGLGLLGGVPAVRANHDTEYGEIPADPGSYDYATMGWNDAAPTAQVLGNFKCPYTQDFVRNHLPAVVEEYVDPGYLQVQFRQVAYEPYPNDYSHGDPDFFISNSDARIGAAALGVWNADPENYWEFLDGMFESRVSGWVTYDELGDRMRRVGVNDRSEALSLARSGRYEPLLRDTTETFADVSAPHTPRLLLDGEITNPRWGLSRWLDARLDTSEPPTRDSDSSGSGTGGSSGGSNKRMSVVGTGEGTEYRFTVSGSLDAGSNVEGGDSVSGSTAEGTVTWMSDNYAFGGEIESFDVVSGDPDVDIWIEGEKYAPSDFASSGADASADLNRELSVIGPGERTGYRIRVSGAIAPTENVESGDSASGSTATGSVKWVSDNYRYSGDVRSVDVLDGDADLVVYANGRKYRASDL